MSVVGDDGIVWNLRNFTLGDAVPDRYLFDFFYQPIVDMYSWMQDLFANWPQLYNGQLPQNEGMAVSSWYRNPARQRLAEQRAGQKRTLSSHMLGTAFDIFHPDGQGAYLTMGAHADNWWGGVPILTYDASGNVTGADPHGAGAAGRWDGWWTADYAEGDLHFHIQRWFGNTPDWQSWVAALQADAPQYLA